MNRKLLVSAVVPALLATFGAAGAARAGAATAVEPGTRANLLEAMRGEALAFVAYNAFADSAAREGYSAIASLLRTTGAQERDEHFAEQAHLAGLVQSQDENLEEAILAEDEEATALYPEYAKQAATAGDGTAADLFSELASDEADHRERLQEALRALRGGGACPAPPDIHVEIIEAGPARSSGKTLLSIARALRGEAFASAKYRQYASYATGHGRADVGRLLTRLSEIERFEHFAALATLAGLVRDVRTNLTAAHDGENNEATTMYPAYAKAAETAGDSEAGARFREIARDEAKHRDAFTRALSTL